MAGSSSQNPVPKLYMSVVEDVISNVREAFLDDGVDESVLEELKTLWLHKLEASKALVTPQPAELKHHLPPEYLQQAQQHTMMSQSHITQRQQQPQHTQLVTPSHTQTHALQHVQQGQHRQQPGQQNVHPVHLPIKLTGNRELTSAAQAANMALPAGLFQQQLLAGNINIQQTNTGQLIAVQTMPGAGGVQGVQGVQGVHMMAPNLALAHQQLQQQQQQKVQGHITQLDGSSDPLPCSSDQSNDHKSPPTHSTICTSSGQQSLSKCKSKSNPRGSRRRKVEVVVQLDGTGDTSSEEEEDEGNEEGEGEEEGVVERSEAIITLVQLDGTGDTSSEEEEDEGNEEGEEDGVVEEPLNSDDDISEADPAELFDTENVVVCQYDKINRNKNRWKFQLKDGIMNLNGRDYVFQRANGDAEW